MAVLLQARPDSVGAFLHFRALQGPNKSFRMKTIQIVIKTKSLKSFVFTTIRENPGGRDAILLTWPFREYVFEPALCSFPGGRSFV